MTGPQRQPPPYVDPATGLATPAVSGPHGYPSGAYPYPVDPSASGSYPPPGAFPVAPQGYPGGVYASDPSVSGSFPPPGTVPAAPLADPATSGSFPPPGSVPVGPQGFPSGAYPAGSGPFPVGPDGSGPHPGGASGPDGGWSYGLPTGPRPDLLQTPIGQAGALRGNSWQQNAARGASYPWLVWAELRKLFATTSDRVVMTLAPVMLVGVLVVAALFMDGWTSVAAQSMPMLVALAYGPMLLHVAMIKTYTGEWHYRSIQLSLLLQPSRAKLTAAQLGAVVVIWVVLTLVEWAGYLGLRGVAVDDRFFVYYLPDRPLWLLGVTALTAALSLLICAIFCTLLKNPTAAITVYFLFTYLLVGVGLLGFQTLPGLEFASPYALAMTCLGLPTSPIAAITSTVVLLAALVTGVLLVGKRDAR